jgi:cell division protein FtsQ
MRHVTRIARRGRPGASRKPPPRLWALRLRRVALVVAGLGLLGGTADALSNSSAMARLASDLRQSVIGATADAGFVVTRVYSEGRVLADERSLADALAPYYGKPILSVDLDELKARVEKVSWVRSASVGRRLPDTIWVRLDEHRPIARWVDGAEQVLVSDAQAVFRVQDPGKFKQLPLLSGKGAPVRAEELLRLVAGEPDLAAHVTGARLVGERRWDVILDNRVQVRLPEKKPDSAWRRLAAEDRASSLLGRAITAVDLRNPEWLTLQMPDAVLEPSTKAPRA